MKLTLNLATRSYPNRRALTAGVSMLLVILSIALLINLIGWLKEDNQYRQLSERLEVLEKSLDQKHPEPTTIYTPEALEAQRFRINLANRLLVEDAFRWTALLDRFEEVMPAGVRLGAISPSFKDNEISITGWTDDVAVLRTLLDRLLESDYFSTVRLERQSRPAKQDSGAAVQFSLSLTWQEKETL